ncbi:MAG: hypothetical protein M3Q03_11185 [Chloroflexota bacterium]|nr:hypothetical protein [Chloroflexota bacterium]
MDGSFAQAPKDMPAVIDLVRREAREECLDDRLPAPVLDRCVRDAVAAMWDSRIKTFVPLLALRRVRGCIRAGTCAGDDW